jgi:beta-glucosidase
MTSTSAIRGLALAQLLPTKFLFGVATAAYQVEGAAHQDGRGQSIWDRFLADRKFVHSGDTGEVACDHYHHFKEDIRLMNRIGVDAYRFSFAWPRIFPHGDKELNKLGVDFYDRLIDELLKKDIKPFATLYHWDLPLTLQAKYGGWLSRETLSRFADYASFMVRKFGDRVQTWTTFNEPEVIISGYTGLGMAPGLNHRSIGFHVGHNLMVAHGLALKAMRAENRKTQVGIVLNFNIIDGKDNSEKCVLASRRHFIRAYSWYLDGLLNGKYPIEIHRCLGQTPKLAFVSPRSSAQWVRSGDMKLIAQRLDFIGINYYTRFVVNEKGCFFQRQHIQRTQMGWEIYPFGLARLLDQLNSCYRLPPMYITENGVAFRDTVRRGRIHDQERREFIFNHVLSLTTAIKNGVDVRGYFVWSLLDNLEWALGFSKTFGIVHVERRSGRLHRTIKDSGLAYTKLIRTHRRYRPKRLSATTF